MRYNARATVVRYIPTARHSRHGSRLPGLVSLGLRVQGPVEIDDHLHHVWPDPINGFMHTD
jgi:hypothetical protein